MRIKSLTIHGFKSFVDKVTLNFSTGASAIIGPNGCGKSNIVDAIRWVIGEQNPRHLRGKLMEDVIFNGSDSRKPMGMAEVVLTFSNEEGKAPARFKDFTEIEVSRRLYRSGESEYYMNKVQCRLRDIADLFMDTGVGTRAYSIVEQGQVSWLVNAKPEERRMLFEEAAGISKFRQKKEAALRRLEATRENLTRVQDIISEVKRQLNSLDRQAKKAERYKVLKEEMKQVDVVLSAFEMRRLNEEIASLSKRLAGVKDRDMETSAKIASTEGMAVEIKEEYLREEALFKSVREKAYSLERLIQAEENGSALAGMRIEELKRNTERLFADIEELRAESGLARAAVERLSSALEEAGSLISAGSEKADKASSMLSSIALTLREKEETEAGLKAASLGIASRITDIRHALQMHLKDEDVYRGKAAKAASEKEEIAKTLEDKAGPALVLSGSLRQISEKKDAAAFGLSSVKERLLSLEHGKAAKDEEIKRIGEEEAAATARLSALEEMERKFEGVKGGARAMMLKRDRDGVHGLIADVIETNPGYEKAVEAVMGERLQYIMVESHREGIEAIDYLKKNLGGRGSFVPVRDLRALNAPVPASSGGYAHPGVKELISEVRVRDGFHAIVDLLMGDVLVVEDLEAAMEMWRNNGIYGKTLVTLEGTVVDPQGVITGGSSSGAESGIMQKRSEIKNIRSTTAGLERRREELSGEKRVMEEDILRHKALLEEAVERLHSVEIEKINMEGELKRHEEDIARLTDATLARASEVSEAIARLSSISAKKAELTSERERLEAEASGREGAIALIAEEIASLANEKERLASAVTEMKVSLAQSRERYESIRKELSEKERFTEEVNRKISLKKEEIEAARVEASLKAEEVMSIKARIEGLLAKAGTIKSEETERGETLSLLNVRLQEADSGLKALKTALSGIQEMKGALSIEIREAELNSRNLREKMVERYGLDVDTPPLPSEEAAPLDAEALEARRLELKDKIDALGAVSLSALEEYSELQTRHQFLLDQQADLSRSVETLHGAIIRINRTTREMFRNAFEEINRTFQTTFAISLIFAIFLIKPSPFCLLDEVDAPLDDANINRFNMFVREMSALSQFLLITHNKRTMEMADSLYGITMEEPGVSKIISVRF
ncbi:MAG: chromosome segregation protein SMC [Deltaproteobacteria bacterium]|nr:chromosome segregation protein SMC [Deltaproteobacteria bacterium]